MTLCLQFFHDVRGKDDDVSGLTGTNQPSRLDPAHRPDSNLYSGPLLITCGEVGQNLPRRHGRNARQPIGHPPPQRSCRHILHIKPHISRANEGQDIEVILNAHYLGRDMRRTKAAMRKRERKEKCKTAVKRSCRSSRTIAQVIEEIGGCARIRTLDPLIKSQLLYQLSYTPVAEASSAARCPLKRPCV